MRDMNESGHTHTSECGIAKVRRRSHNLPKKLECCPKWSSLHSRVASPAKIGLFGNIILAI